MIANAVTADTNFLFMPHLLSSFSFGKEKEAKRKLYWASPRSMGAVMCGNL